MRYPEHPDSVDSSSADLGGISSGGVSRVASWSMTTATIGSNGAAMPGGSILGNPVRRVEDPKFLTVGGTYVDDVRDPLLDGAAFVHYARANVAHARILSIDVSAAKAAPGVVAVFTCADLDAAGVGPFPPEMPIFPKEMARPFLARGVVRYVGEPIVAIVTEERGQGPDAAELVVIDYETLPVLIDPEAALAPDAQILFEGLDSNVPTKIKAVETDGFDDALAACEVVVRLRILNSKIAPAALEPRSAAAVWSGGRLHHWTTCQGPHPFRGVIAAAFGLDKKDIRVITPDVGGGFGAKAVPYPEDILLDWIAKTVDRPVRWFSNRSDDMVNLGHGRAQIQNVEMGGNRDGRITAYRLTVLQDSGAYPRYGAYLPNMTKLMQPGVYDIANLAFSSVSVVTNTTPVVPFRGAGRPEASAAIERAVDRFAVEIGMDPAEVRRRNVLAPFSEVHTTFGGAAYDSGDYPEMLKRALDAAGYDDLRAEQSRRRLSGDPKMLGIGISTYVEVTAGGGGSEYAMVEVLPNGKIRAHTGSLPYGTGHVTSWSMLIADRLGVAMSDIEVLFGDTDVVARGGLTGGSRSLQLAGSSMQGAAELVLDQARLIAADLLEAAAEDVVIDSARGVLHVAGSPAPVVSWTDLATEAAKRGTTLRAEFEFKQTGATFPSGAHISVVEVDSETGRVTLLRHIACDDAGRLLNPLIVAGQVHGGVAQGAAQALLEEFRYDEDGNPLTANFADYGVISATEMPMIDRVILETPSPLNPLGAKGIGESGTIGSTPAVQNAVVDALAHLGVRHVDMPATAEKVWRAIQSAGV